MPFFAVSGCGKAAAVDFEFEPPIERRAACNYVGLKNAGATCYMNSVLQQLYVTPGPAQLIRFSYLVKI